jgi:hypothetical protein
MQHIDDDPRDRFPTDPAGLPEATGPEVLELADGDTLALRVGPVAKRLGDTTGARDKDPDMQIAIVQPPFDGGHPSKASKTVVDEFRKGKGLS